MTPSLIDVAVNFSSKQLDGKVPSLVAEAKRVGVVGAVAVGTSVAASGRAAELAAANPDYLRATAGIHPHYASSWTSETPGKLTTLLGQPGVAAVGECGLDYNRMLSDKAQQLEVFTRHLDIAASHGLPVYLHCREAFPDFLAVLREFPGIPGIVHCFTGTPHEAEALLAQGLDLGITGWVCDLARARDLRKAIPLVPTARIHLETDAPYLYPALPGEGSARRRTNTPSMLPRVLAEVAKLKRTDPAALATQCTTNSRRLFRFGE